jgi:hypothetical protein
MFPRLELIVEGSTERGATILSITTAGIMTFSITTLSIMTFSITKIKCDTQNNDTTHNCSVDILNVIYVECHKQTQYGECCYSECRYAECRYAECCYAKCRSALKRHCNLLESFCKKNVCFKRRKMYFLNSAERVNIASL